MDYYVGEIRMFSGNYAPQDWRVCDGSLLNINEYQVLYSLLGTYWGGNGTTTFGIPDLRGRVPVGQGAGPGLTSRTLAQTGGVETVALTDLNTLPAHSHTMSVTSAVADQPTPANTLNLGQPPSPSSNYLPPAKLPNPPQPRVMDTRAIEQVGGGQAHDNVMPSFAVNFLICVNGIYPQRQ